MIGPKSLDTSPGLELIQTQEPKRSTYETIAQEYTHENPVRINARPTLLRLGVVGGTALALLAGRQFIEGVSHPERADAAALAVPGQLENTLPQYGPNSPNACPNPLAGAGTYDFTPAGDSNFTPGTTDLVVTARDTYAIPGRTDVKNNYICAGPNEKNILTVQLDNKGSAITLGRITVMAGAPGLPNNLAGLHFKKIEPAYASTTTNPNLTLTDCRPGASIDGRVDDSTYSCDFSESQGASVLLNVASVADRAAAKQPLTVEATTGITGTPAATDVTDTNPNNNLFTNNFTVVEDRGNVVGEPSSNTAPWFPPRIKSGSYHRTSGQCGFIPLQFRSTKGHVLRDGKIFVYTYSVRRPLTIKRRLKALSAKTSKSINIPVCKDEHFADLQTNIVSKNSAATLAKFHVNKQVTRWLPRFRGRV
jgi:predicted secreted protein